MIHSSCDQKEELKMNKEKTLKIVENLINTIRKNENNPEYECAKPYVDTWVVGALKTIQEKINGNEFYYGTEQTYAQLFQEFICTYFCLNINPSIKIYAIACLFSFELRTLIIDLYNHLFTLDQRVLDAQSVGYIYEYSQDSEQTMFEIIRRCYTQKGRC